jgi:hypothetical protein
VSAPSMPMRALAVTDVIIEAALVIAPSPTSH